MQEDWPRLLVQAASVLGIALQERQVGLFTLYHRELTAWNEKTNLLSRRDTEDTLLRHFLDSLTAAAYLPGRECSVLDMGSGGGLPGIPLKIAVDTLQVSLLEASRKKTSFLKHVIRTLQIMDIKVIHDRAEKLRKQENYRHSFETVLSRAAFKLPEFIALGAFFLAPGGTLMAMKGNDIRAELEEAEPVAAASGLYLSASHELALPLTGERRRILIYQKS